jgi:hypothetical protein
LRFREAASGPENIHGPFIRTPIAIDSAHAENAVQLPQIEDRTEACPFIEANDTRCNSHFTLGHLSQAFGDCMGQYQQCPNYHRLSATINSTRVIATLHGRQLQPTGT